MSAYSRRSVLVALVMAGACAIATAAGGGRATLPRCATPHLRLSGHLNGATQSLLGALTLTNRSENACALPPAPRRVSVMIGRQILPTLTVPLRSGRATTARPTRILPGRGRVSVLIQWRNWCGSPRGTVPVSIALTIFAAATPRLKLGLVTTPPCVEAKFSSTIAVSRFLRRQP